MVYKISAAALLILTCLLYWYLASDKLESESPVKSPDIEISAAQIQAKREFSPEQKPALNVPSNDTNLKEMGKTLEALNSEEAKRVNNEETADEDWDYDTSYQLYDFLRTHKELMHLDVKEVSCREVTCQIEIFLYGNGVIETAQFIGEKLKSSDAWKDYSFYFDSEPDKGVIRVEIEKPVN